MIIDVINNLFENINRYEQYHIPLLLYFYTTQM